MNRQLLALHFRAAQLRGICESGSLVPDLFVAAETLTASALPDLARDPRSQIAGDGPPTG